ncbi:MAG: hypothetical protein CMP12_01610 [Zunongwangia sp.]|uniref:Type I restriction modification DNA specificity domain-containing protein n=1 Tax=Zunongwangia profunda TaxID=398743 RepID=A0A3D5J3E5_9FLAO|nr:restriction endonuclease subunit S [Zunongwangia profunda]MAO34609.1 hypothetical protein [Zunongwangia sp.]HCV82493.1 hypothetical protein [Zunongwangia profunda]|tara:strand:+ start:2086 stop:3330 length:1245 start_codon:yes stop_codon:yes gene_type:complete
MRSNYKRIGDYIEQVKVKNKEGLYSKLLGINIDKFFMPSVANTVGVNLNNYKIVKKGQFACNRMHVGRDYRIPIAISDKEIPFLVSPAYDVFQIKKEDDLLPEYLMMWFRRKEYDRNAWFHTDADVRGGLAWEAFCDLKLPIPSIEIQREIVKEYNTVTNRIKLNENLNQKLEETAQALYKYWFVDFEFPTEEGQSYKSSGGEMVYNEELDKEIPAEWEVITFSDFGEVVTGKTPSSNCPEDFGEEISFVTPGDFKNFKKFTLGTERYLSNEGAKKLKNKILPKGSVIVTCIGSAMGKIVVAENDCITNQQMNSIKVKHSFYTDFLYHHLIEVADEIKSIALGSSTMPMINKTDFEKISTLKPKDNLLVKYEYFSKKINELTINHSKEIQQLESLKSLLLAKMAKLGEREMVEE